MENLSLTIPLLESALRNASSMLSGMADDMSTPGLGSVKDRMHGQVTGRFTRTTEPEAELVKDTLVPETGNGTLAGWTLNGKPIVGSVGEDTSEVGELVSETIGEETHGSKFAPTVTADTPDAAPDARDTVSLDGEGLPWDPRIHSSSKALLVKSPQGWKKKRGLDAEVVAEVEDELRQAMSVPAPSPVVVPAPSNPFSAPPIPFGEEPEPQEDPNHSVSAPITTFPGLMQATTGSGVSADRVQEAVASVGLQSLPLLAARPDLIPAVAKHLGL